MFFVMLTVHSRNEIARLTIAPRPARAQLGRGSKHRVRSARAQLGRGSKNRVVREKAAESHDVVREKAA